MAAPFDQVDLRVTRLRLAAVTVAILLAVSLNAAAPESLYARVVQSFVHDSQAFTQGLLVANGKLYESTGLYGHSTVRRVDILSGRVESSASLGPGYFGEGLARVGEWLVQLTWREETAFVWNMNTLQKEREFTYTGEGWGLCFDDRSLIMSDGSDRLTFRDPETFAVTHQVQVNLSGAPLASLNELECGGGVVYANVWRTNTIVRIDAQSGNVTAMIDASNLLTPAERQRADVLNGIAAIPGTNRFLITGKFWPKVFEVEFVPMPPRRRPATH